MKEIEIQSTSRNTAECNPIIIRESKQVRLVFLPTLVKNLNNPEACVNGHFIYQRKNKKSEWISISKVPLTSLKSGEGYKLQLHSQELLTLLRELRLLYKLYKQQGIPIGHTTFVRLEASLAKFLELGETDLIKFLESHSDAAATTLLKLIKWISSSPQGNNAAKKIANMALEQLPALTILVGVATVKDALHYWRANQENTSEEFWQSELTNRTYVLSQMFAYPVVVVRQKAYVGGKRLNNRGGNIVDYLVAVESTGAVILIEIKTPATKLLGPQYRDGVFPFSSELSGAIVQVLRYRQSLMNEFHNIMADRQRSLIVAEPRCLVVAGNVSKELSENDKRASFELQRERLQGISVIGYDELFLRLEHFVALLES